MTLTPAPVPPAGLEFIQAVFIRLIQLSVGTAFVVVMIMLATAGIKYLTSGGESKALASANNTITWALLGLIFVIIAWLILRLIEAFTGIPVTRFCLSFQGCP